MSQNSRLDSLRTLQHHYLRATKRAEKSPLLDTGQELLAVGRKYRIGKLCSR